jgi:hypothetical protein
LLCSLSSSKGFGSSLRTSGLSSSNLTFKLSLCLTKSSRSSSFSTFDSLFKSSFIGSVFCGKISYLGINITNFCGEGS